MKKRILSILLAVMMVVPMLTMAIPVSAAGEPETIYSWNGFELKDIRNIEADKGQVVDLGFAGPVATEPVLDGVIGNKEYTKTTTIPLLSGKATNDANKTVDASFAVYGDYLYVAVDLKNSGLAVDSRLSTQWDIGVAGSASAESSWNRIGIGINTSGVVASTRSPWSHAEGADRYYIDTAAVSLPTYLVANAYSAGVYEVKIDLGELFRLYANLPGGQDVWDTPCVNFSFWCLSGGEYHFALANTTKMVNASGRGGDWVSNTVIIPKVTFDAIKAEYKGVVGDKGTDWRFLADDQIIFVDKYATQAPTVDGVVQVDGSGNNIEYTTTAQYTTYTAYSTYGAITASYSVIDGYLYGAFQFKYKQAGMHLGAGAHTNAGPMMASRLQTKINLSDGVYSWNQSQGGMYKNAQGLTGDAYDKVVDGNYVYDDAALKWINLDTASEAVKTKYADENAYPRTQNIGTHVYDGGWVALTAKNEATYADVEAYPRYVKRSGWATDFNGAGMSAAQGFKNVKAGYADGVTTLEFQISLPVLLAMTHAGGWNTDEASVVGFMFWPDESASNLKYSRTEDERDAIRLKTGYMYDPGYGNLCVKLPEGWNERYFVEDLDDLGEFGQDQANVTHSVATLDGIIGASEYTGSLSYDKDDFVDYNYTQSGVAKSTKNYPFHYDITQTDYFAYDKDNLYIATKIVDPTFDRGYSMIQWNFNVLNKNDPKIFNKLDSANQLYYNNVVPNKVDLGDATTRINISTTVNNNGDVTLGGSYGSIGRAQTGNFSWPVSLGSPAADGVVAKGSYDADTNTVICEMKIPFAAFKKYFQVDEIENIMYFTLYRFGLDEADKYSYEKDAKTTNVTYSYAQTFSYDNNGAGWSAIQTLTKNSYGIKTFGYTNHQIPNLIKLVDAPLTKDSASARISTTAAGLRFKSVYSNDYLAYMAEYAEAKGETMEVGTLIAPDDYIVDKNFTHAALGDGRYVEVMADVNNAFENVNGVTTIAGSLVKIKTENLDRDFAGRGFIKIGDEYFYTDTYTVRNIKDVATAALADPSANYTAGQREILGRLNGTVQ